MGTRVVEFVYSETPRATSRPSKKFHLIQKLHQDLRIIKQHMIEVRVVQQQLQEVDQDQFSQIWKRTKIVFN